MKSPTDEDTPRPARLLRILALVFGLISAALAIAMPFMPVTQDITTLDWPTDQGTRAISAPLTAQSPVSLDSTVPCHTARELDDRSEGPGTLFNTNAQNSDYGKLTGMSLEVHNGLLTLTSRGQQLGTLPLEAGDCAIVLHSDAAGTTATVGNTPLAAVAGDHRPQLTGIFSDLETGTDSLAGLSVSAQVDNRWDNTATAIKWIALGLSVLCFIGSLVVVQRLDRSTGRRAPRLAPKAWWKPTFRDIVILGTLIVWWLIGAMTADDGYFLTMAEVRGDAGYIGEYYRWLATADSPFAWHVDIYAAMTHVSSLIPWMRLPSLLMGMVCWLLISREVMPRLGQQVRRSSAAGWAAGAVFLVFWMPYNNGLRPENLVAMLSLISLCAVERAVATRRLTPALLGLMTAALSVAANPHGLMAVLPFVVAAKPLLRLIRTHARSWGWAAVLAPIAAAGFVVLNLIFYDQTFAAAYDAVNLRGLIGPSDPWYNELVRYVTLFSQNSDGSLSRRFPVLLVFLCLATCAAVLLRQGRIRGAALGPSRRLLGISALSFVVLALTPTKHSHHFGMLAAVGGALAALTALATSTTVLSSRRNRAGFLAGLLFITALAVTGPNAWWYVSGWGVPWSDIPPQMFGISLSTMLVFAAGVSLVVAVIEHMRLDENKPVLQRKPESGPLENRGRALRLGLAPLSIVCTLLMLFEIGSLAKAIDKRWDTYNPGTDNILQVADQSCGLSDYINVEREPLDGMLVPSENQPKKAVPDAKPPGDWQQTQETGNSWLDGTQQGFLTGEGLPPESSQDPARQVWKPPYQMGTPDTPNAPVWGSYEASGYGTSAMRTSWYPIPERARDQSVPIVVAIAGLTDTPNSLIAEFGKETDEGFQITERRPVAAPGGPWWRDARISVDGAAHDADQVRLVAKDRGLGLDAWMAFSAPRAPQLAKMTEVIGAEPTFREWAAASQHPCLTQSGIDSGVAETPKYRVSAGERFREIGAGWSSPDAGGSFGWLNVSTTMRELPTYLKGDVRRDWGTLYEVDPYVPDALPAEAAMHKREETHSGLWSMGPFAPTIHLPGDVPNSDNRADLPNDSDESDQSEDTEGK